MGSGESTLQGYSRAVKAVNDVSVQGHAVHWKCWGLYQPSGKGLGQGSPLPALQQGSPALETKRAPKLKKSSDSRCEREVLVFVPWYRPPTWGTLEEAFNLLVCRSPISPGELAVSSGRAGAAAGGASGSCSEQCRSFLSLWLMVSVSACSAVTQIRLVTSSGLNHPKEGEDKGLLPVVQAAQFLTAFPTC